MAKLGLVIGGVVIAGLAYLPVYEKNMINEEVQKVVNTLENNGFSVEMTPCKGYLSSSREFTLKITDGVKAANFILDEAGSSIPKKNRYLVDAIKKDIQTPMEQKNLNKTFNDTIFKGSIHHSNIGTSSIDAEVNLIDAPFIKKGDDNFKELCKNGKLGVNIHYKDNKAFSIDLKDITFAKKYTNISFSGFTVYAKKGTKHFMSFKNISYSYKSSYKTESLTLDNFSTNMSYQNEYNNKINTKLGSIKYFKKTPYRDENIDLENLSLTSYVKELSSISASFTTSVEKLHIFGGRKSSPSSNTKQDIVLVDNFKFKLDVKNIAKKPFKKFMELEQQMSKNPYLADPTMVEKVSLDIFHKGFNVYAKSSVNSVKFADAFNLHYPLNIDMNLDINKNDIARIDLIQKYMSFKANIKLDAKNTQSPSPMIGQPLYDMYLKKGEKVGSNLVYKIEFEQGGKPLLNGKPL